jgi:GH24 family phage-related lysozyme (muramidase)
MKRLSPVGRNKLKGSESFREFAYPDPYSPLALATKRQRWGFVAAAVILAGLPADVAALSGKPWTCGYGQTNGVTLGTRMTLAEAEADLDSSLLRYEALVDKACTLEPTQGQFDALVQLAWNCEAALNPAKSTVVKAHNRGDFAAAAKAFELYCKSNGKDSAALLARRKREGADYLAGSELDPVGEALPLVSPQVVDAERPLTRSKINLAQAGTAAIATVTGASEVLKTVGDFKDSVAGLGEWFVPMACLAVVGLCGFTIWQRWDMRRRGVV